MHKLLISENLSFLFSKSTLLHLLSWLQTQHCKNLIMTWGNAHKNQMFWGLARLIKCLGNKKNKSPGLKRRVKSLVLVLLDLLTASVDRFVLAPAQPRGQWRKRRLSASCARARLLLLLAGGLRRKRRPYVTISLRPNAKAERHKSRAE